MSNAALWAFVREHGVMSREVVAALLGAVVLGGGLALAWRAFQISKKELTYRDVVVPPVSVLMGLVFGFGALRMVRERYLLQPGMGRYTVATVFKRDTWRGKQRFAYEYYLGGERWQTGKGCGSENGYALECPAVGERLYIYYAPESPGTTQVLAVPVPDTLRHIPPLGWAKLP